ncbi:MAG: hypothetical protein GKR92_11450 [Gammaproteobacteria bacterium]|nr:MAG: hypothetical protein GKR92_11450 [Gammaproteobacteria bacterium]
MEIKDIVISSKAKFLRCKNGIAYYALTVPYSEMLYSFPVPLNTMQDEALAAESHTIYFMDYIHKAIREGTLIKEAA